ncbi:MAG: putative DNA binding domain-containing protein [Treponema sp.]|jgi:ATP-dependent DNA helicase RecG|nr:putative DNA binding domain-containing protein [Treponema sp.]
MQTKELVKFVNSVRKLGCETQTLEVKAAHKGCPARLYGTLSAFSNQDGGGIIIFGIDEEKNFEIVGVYDPHDLQRHVAEQCKQMKPAVRPLFTVCEINKKTIVSAEIPGVDVSERPVYYMGTGRMKGSYIRVGAEDEPMSDYEVYSYDAYRRRIRDDIRVVDIAGISQFRQDAVNDYILSVKKEKEKTSKLSDEKILNFMGIVKDGKPTIAGVLCFHEYPQIVFPQLCVTAVVVPGLKIGDKGDEGERFSANKRIEGTIMEMVDETMFFVTRNMREKTIVEEGRRNDRAEYPAGAVREAIINALMHRDYSIHTEGAPVRVIMYNDRLEIINEGGLYGKLTIDRLGKVHGDTRNQTLAHILETQKIAENRYSGIPTIREEMAACRLPEPVFESKRGSFIVTLKNGYDSRLPDIIPSNENSLTHFCKTPRSREEIANFLGKTQYYVVKIFIDPLLDKGILKMTIPDKPKSKNQKYYSNFA